MIVIFIPISIDYNMTFSAGLFEVFKPSLGSPRSNVIG